MPNEQDTTAGNGETVETEAAQVNGTEVSTPSSTETAAENQNNQGAPDIEAIRREAEEAKQRAEAAEKERDKERMRINQLENERKEREKAEREKLEQAGEWETLAKAAAERERQREEAEAKRLADEQARREQDEQNRRTNEIRDEVLKDFPEDVQKLAKDLDIWWESAEDVPSAQQNLRTKLTKLQESLGIEEAPTQHPNNPIEVVDGKPLQEMTLEELRKVLPKAEPRI